MIKGKHPVLRYAGLTALTRRHPFACSPCGQRLRVVQSVLPPASRAPYPGPSTALLKRPWFAVSLASFFRP